MTLLDKRKQTRASSQLTCADSDGQTSWTQSSSPTARLPHNLEKWGQQWNTLAVTETDWVAERLTDSHWQQEKHRRVLSTVEIKSFALAFHQLKSITIPWISQDPLLNPIYAERKGETKAEKTGESAKEELSHACVLPCRRCSSVESPPAASASAGGFSRASLLPGPP